MIAYKKMFRPLQPKSSYNIENPIQQYIKLTKKPKNGVLYTGQPTEESSTTSSEAIKIQARQKKNEIKPWKTLRASLAINKKHQGQDTQISKVYE